MAKIYPIKCQLFSVSRKTKTFVYPLFGGLFFAVIGGGSIPLIDGFAFDKPTFTHKQEIYISIAAGFLALVFGIMCGRKLSNQKALPEIGFWPNVFLISCVGIFVGIFSGLAINASINNWLVSTEFGIGIGIFSALLLVAFTVFFEWSPNIGSNNENLSQSESIPVESSNKTGTDTPHG